MSGQALAEAANWLGMPAIFSSQAMGAPFFSILLFICAFLVTVRGPVAIQKYTAVNVPVFMVLMFGLLAIVLFGQGFTKVAHILPSELFETTSRSFATALELNIGLGFSWLPYLGQYSRLSKTEGGAFKAGFYSYGIIVCIAALVGALAALVAGSLNPSDWMFSIAGSWGGFIGLILLSVGNVGAAIFLMYSQAVSFKTVFPKKSWMIAMGTTVPTIFLLLSSTFYDAFGSFIAVISFIMAVLGGIVVADYFFVKRQRIAIRDLYDTQGSYTYWKGINPSAVLTVVIGTIVYEGGMGPLNGSTSVTKATSTSGIPLVITSLSTVFSSSRTLPGH
jgi:purine-cytosine permease-like protein